MNNTWAVLAGTMISAATFSTATLAQIQPPSNCVTQNMGVPPNANTSDKGAPFFIDTTGLDLQTKPPTRDPKSANYPPATELADGTLPPAGAEGNFIIGPTHNPAPETIAKEGVPKGTITTFTLSSKDSVIYNPGLIRDDVAGCGNSSIMSTTTVSGDKSNMIVTTSHPGTWTRNIEVYVPANYVRGTEIPFIVLGDGGSTAWKDMNTTLDNLIAQRRVPPMVSIQVGNGGQDAQGAQRGREYDTVSGTYAQFIEREVLPLVEEKAGVKLTKNPDGRATMGLSSSGTAAFTMAWFHPELYRRVLAYSPTMVNQQWPWNPALRGGAWEYHSAWAGPAGPNLIVKAGQLTPSDQPTGAPLIPGSPTKPIRYWFEMGDQDLFYPNPTIPDGMHDWTLSAALMAKVLAEKGYHYQYLFARNAKHVDRPTVAQTLPSALEWLWKGYQIP
ncbi:MULTISPECIES: alpha/beta hydrolase [Bradyrhizobium]|uniref:alpha/beta hydrolase n=1 Tax=Bradyrhizobium TaxID=374 RepID=UPI00155E740A|nr:MULTISPECIES: alpha/beta hydrolase-fold protein [Bradyrhizobium]MDD1520687.1 esterase [Bradyrhizobium sp. WBAH30]MDD1545739.1 esterase [Bradyrhizobium sp. WBAH41]MDD1559000.1 esterase [Bradyrhizobium sp. WBAH23]MDD1566349.1 esterase [Bradyrhizobium sp. WBAH33]MDD1591943.1 esterase [Bradyrhizobium sp. WBAH42]